MPDWTSRRVLLGGVIAALVLSLASAGLAVWAVSRTPESGHAGPRGAAGPSGKQGPAGIEGAAGPVGPTGAAGKQGLQGDTGSPGTVRSTEVISGALVQTGPNPPVGTMLSANTQCPARTVLLSGGATVSTGNGIGPNVELRSSSPISSSVWRVVGEVIGLLGTGQVMMLKPFVLCGVG